MSPLLDAFWRAAAYCLHPRLIALSLLPVLLIGTAAAGLAYFFWSPAVEAIRATIDGLTLLAPVTDWLDEVSNGMFRRLIGPVVVVALSVPVLLISALLLVSAFMGSAIVELVGRRRFPDLERRRGGSWLGALAGSIGWTLMAAGMLIVSLPFWLIPPLALLLPPLIWGWLSFKVMSYDALAEHASREERQVLMGRHRWPLLAMGLITGYLGAAPSLVWASGVMMLPMMPLLMPVFVWLYTLVFAFASAWFTHYALAALVQLRRERLPTAAASPLPDALPPGASDPPALPDTGKPTHLA